MRTIRLWKSAILMIAVLAAGCFCPCATMTPPWRCLALSEEVPAVTCTVWDDYPAASLRLFPCMWEPWGLSLWCATPDRPGILCWPERGKGYATFTVSATDFSQDMDGYVDVRRSVNQLQLEPVRVLVQGHERGTSWIRPFPADWPWPGAGVGTAVPGIDGGFLVHAGDIAVSTLLKLDPTGAATWQRPVNYGFLFSAGESGYVMEDISGSASGEPDRYLLFDKDGNEVWAVSASNQSFMLEDAAGMPDGGVVLLLTAYSPEELSIRKVGPSGAVEWVYLFDDNPTTICVTADGKVAVLCWGISNDIRYDALYLVDGQGALVSRQEFAPGNFPHGVWDMQAACNGDLVLTGSWDDGAYVARLDASANVLWRTVIPEANSLGVEVVAPMKDGDIVVGGAPWTGVEPPQGTFLVKLDADGQREWSKRLDGDHMMSIIQTDDGGYLLAGNLGYEFWMVKTDAQGQSIACRPQE